MPYRALLITLAIAAAAVLSALHLVAQAQEAARRLAAEHAAKVCRAVGDDACDL
ncbi:MAG TPA: hypothetical protein P5305_03990 [Rubrivivax sp.]|nr:hypothetical protein [Rubrivivax sp.]HRY87023.1 hypothetical protein [Rubrivivax sp.]